MASQQAKIVEAMLGSFFLIESVLGIQVPLEEAEADPPPLPDLMPALRQLAEGDREVLEKGVKAFVSYVRGYKEHHCKFIFRMADLNLGQLAYACALLQLPKMPEIRKVAGKVAGFEPSLINPNDVKVRI